MRRALIVTGGWEGHLPGDAAEIFRGWLEAEGFAVEPETSLDALDGRLAGVDLVVLNWTMGRIEEQQLDALLAAVEGGSGLAGVHGGLCDAFREATRYQLLTGGQFVAHPGNDGTRYRVRIADRDHPITAGLPDFEVVSEQYYLHVDPANHVLATTLFPVAPGPHTANGELEMPVAWTRRWGAGRVFYCAIGHDPSLLAVEPTATLCRRGFVWAARGAPGTVR